MPAVKTATKALTPENVRLKPILKVVEDKFGTQRVEEMKALLKNKVRVEAGTFRIDWGAGVASTKRLKLYAQALGLQMELFFH